LMKAKGILEIGGKVIKTEFKAETLPLSEAKAIIVGKPTKE